jgi:hypothetical protein
MREFARRALLVFGLLFWAGVGCLAWVELTRPEPVAPGSRVARANSAMPLDRPEWFEHQTLPDGTQVSLGAVQGGALWLRVEGATGTTQRPVTGHDAVLALPVRSLRLAFSSRDVGAIVVLFAGSSGVSNGALLLTRDGGTSFALVAMPAGGEVRWQGTTAWLRGEAADAAAYRLTDVNAGWQPAKPEDAPAWLRGPRLPQAQNEAVPQRRLAQVEGSAVESGKGNAFDTCAPPSLQTLATWWHTSPYTAVNIYGGPVWACKSKPYTPEQVARTAAQGWRLIPTWVGPQSACWIGGNVARIPNDLPQAQVLGISDANAAADWMASLGLGAPGNPIYFDLESYPGGGECREAAKAFVDAWVKRVKERGFMAGVYGAPCSSYLGDFATIANPPDAVWIAAWFNDYRFRKGVGTSVSSCLGDLLWANRQRLRQYSGGHNETWGGATLNIDSNVMDGPVVNATCAAPRPAPTEVVLYADANFCGAHRVLGPSTYTNVVLAGFANDSATSLRMGGDVVVLACRDIALGGTCEEITSDDDNLADNAIGNDQLTSLRVVPRPPNGLRCNDAFEPDNTGAAAKALTLNTAQAHTLCNASDEDWVYVDLPAGRTVTVRATVVNASSDPHVTVFAEDGSTVLGSNDDADGYSARVTFTPPRAGRYRIMVRDAIGKGSLQRQYMLSASTGRQYWFPMIRVRS